MPDATVAAFVDHGTVARTVDTDVDRGPRPTSRPWPGSASTWPTCRRVLEEEGVASFTKSYEELLQALHDKANAAAGYVAAVGGRVAVDATCSAPTPWPRGSDTIRRAPPGVLVVFGASGDLTVPQAAAGPRAAQRGAGSCPRPSRWSGVARTDLDDEGFRDLMTDAVPDAAPGWADVVKHSRYVAGDYDDPDTFARARGRAARRRRDRRSGPPRQPDLLPGHHPRGVRGGGRRPRHGRPQPARPAGVRPSGW